MLRRQTRSRRGVGFSKAINGRRGGRKGVWKGEIQNSDETDSLGATRR